MADTSRFLREVQAALDEAVESAQKVVLDEFVEFIHGQYFDRNKGADAIDFPNWQYLEIQIDEWRQERGLAHVDNG